MDYKGKHVTADAILATYAGCDVIMALCEKAIACSGMNVVAATYKRFEPHGLTATWILSESHFTLHTYPEHSYISVDCYTCGGEGDPVAAINWLLDSLGSHQANVQVYLRGLLH